MIWFGVFMLAPSVIYSLHGSMFGLSPHELNVIHYCGMGFIKLVVGPVLLPPVDVDPNGIEYSSVGVPKKKPGYTLQAGRLDHRSPMEIQMYFQVLNFASQIK